MKEVQTAKLFVFDDMYPSSLSLFRRVEFDDYLSHYADMRVITTNEAALAEEQYDRDRVLLWDPDCRYEGVLAYVVFWNNLVKFDLGFGIKMPFVVTLYQGGGFELNNPEKDLLYRKYFFSPYLRKVIVTQSVIRDYLLENGLCPPEKIEYIFSVVTSEKENETQQRLYYPEQKDTFDICFTAFRYSEHGMEKGYPVFIETAKRLCPAHPDMRFHVVGNYSPEVLDVTELGDSIRFYGPQSAEWFDDYYADKDLIVSPNVPFVLAKGNFDGFPTASVTEAASRGVAMFASDPLFLNEGAFADQREIVIIGNDPQEIAAQIEIYYSDPEKLRKLAENGQAKTRELYGSQLQLQRRRDCLSRFLSVIPVMHCFDDKDVIPAAVSMYSMLENANGAYHYILYVLHTDITISNRALLRRAIEPFTHAHIEFINMTRQFVYLWDWIKESGYCSPREILYRLVAPSLFLQYDKMIVTDVDGVFLDDISESFHAFENHPRALIAGVHQVCPRNSWLEEYYRVHYKRCFSLENLDQLKVCGGYLVFHLERMRKANIEEKFLSFLQENAERLLQAEQDVINFCTQPADIVSLPLRYVTCSYMYDLFDRKSSYGTDIFYDAAQIEDALEHPVQLHFATEIKPWNTPLCTKSEVWFSYLGKTGMYLQYMQKQRALPDTVSITKSSATADEIPPESYPVKVSVLCCTYNQEAFLSRTLDSILSQKTEFPYEVIVSDDGSTDTTPEIIARYQKKYPDRIVPILHEKNVGIGENYFGALCRVRGQYLAICDGDDCWIDKEKLQCQVELMDRDTDCMVCGSSFVHHYVESGKNRVYYVNEYIETYHELKPRYSFADLLVCRFLGSCTVMLRWQFHQKVPAFLRYYNVVDLPLMLLHAAYGSIVVLNDKVFSRYSVHAKGITKMTEESVIYSIYNTLINEVDQALDYQLTEAVRKFFAGELTVRKREDSSAPAREISSAPEVEALQTALETLDAELIPAKYHRFSLKACLKVLYRELVPNICKRAFRKLKSLCRRTKRAAEAPLASSGESPE